MSKRQGRVYRPSQGTSRAPEHADGNAQTMTEACLPRSRPCFAARRSGGQGQPLHVGPTCVLRTSCTLTLGKDAVRIYLAFESRQKALAARFRPRYAVDRAGPRYVGADPAPLRRRAHA